MIANDHFFVARPVLLKGLHSQSIVRAHVIEEIELLIELNLGFLFSEFSSNTVSNKSAFGNCFVQNILIQAYKYGVWTDHRYEKDFLRLRLLGFLVKKRKKT